jgi:membrane protein implicated in regulation of membrane protease activity
MEVWHYWIIAGVLCLIAEIFTAGFVVGVLGIGCFGASAACFLGYGLTVQVICFTIATLLGFIFIRPLFMKFMYGKGDGGKIGVEALVGKYASVIVEIDNRRNKGRIRLGAEEWRAASENGNNIDEGQTVKVVRIDGATAYVEVDKEE